MIISYNAWVSNGPFYWGSWPKFARLPFNFRCSLAKLGLIFQCPSQKMWKCLSWILYIMLISTTPLWVVSMYQSSLYTDLDTLQALCAVNPLYKCTCNIEISFMALPHHTNVYHTSVSCVCVPALCIQWPGYIAGSLCSESTLQVYLQYRNIFYGITTSC